MSQHKYAVTKSRVHSFAKIGLFLWLPIAGICSICFSYPNVIYSRNYKCIKDNSIFEFPYSSCSQAGVWGCSDPWSTTDEFCSIDEANYPPGACNYTGVITDTCNQFYEIDCGVRCLCFTGNPVGDGGAYFCTGTYISCQTALVPGGTGNP